MKQYILKNSKNEIRICIGAIQLDGDFELYKEVSELYPLPEKDKFRNAWRISRGQIKVNLAAARVIKRDELLALRDIKLAENAAEFAIKLSLAQDTSEITAKQTLLSNLEMIIAEKIPAKKSVSAIDAYDPFDELGL